MLFSLLLSSAFAQDMATAQTSYTGAIMLEPEIDLSFGGYEALDGTQDAYAYFNGNSLYTVTKMMMAIVWTVSLNLLV